MAFRFARSIFGSGAFQAVRSLVNWLGLIRGRTSLKIVKPPLTYVRTWYATKYLQKLAIDYLQARPEYNAGWKAMIDNMCDRIKNGGYISCTITKTHNWDPGYPVDFTTAHTAEYDVSLFYDLENATNHPDLMANYIQELNEIFEDYKRSYEESNVYNTSAQDEWETRKTALESYRDNVEDLMSEID